MTEQKAKKSPKKAIIIAVAAVLALAVIGAAVALILTRNADNGPEDDKGNPLYPKASSVESVEYLHRDGIDSLSGIGLAEKELTEPEDIASFLEQLKAVELKTPTDEDRTSLDYTADVEMFTLKVKDKNDVTLLIMGDSLSINNEYGNFFYMTDGLDLKTLTKDFTAMDLSAKVASDDAAKTTTK
ncbi:MAG: hypothetical protein J5847_00130 [Clostridia bacterium]|nr:hypothetical protein [Clostridia bacterium]MBR5753929.1 hypothetical protein [Clostridia bacterium]